MKGRERGWYDETRETKWRHIWARRANPSHGMAMSDIHGEYGLSSVKQPDGRIFRIATSILIKKVGHVNNRHGKGKIIT